MYKSQDVDKPDVALDLPPGVRQGGLKGGRGRYVVSAYERAAVRKAKRIGLTTLPRAVALWVGLLRDPRAPMHDRLRAAENIADRFGLPRRSEVDAELQGDAGEFVNALQTAIRAVVREIAADPERYAVRAIDVEYTEDQAAPELTGDSVGK